MQAHIADVASTVERWRGRLLELLFPNRCVNCHRLGDAFCADCRRQINRVTSPICPRCGTQLRDARQACYQCRERPLTITRIRSVAYFDGSLRKAIHAFKYKGRVELAAPLTELLEQYLTHTKWQVDVIAAVPLHTDRQRARGYNQADLLARELARRVRVPFVDGLHRVRATRDQIGLDPAARRVNVVNAFVADASAYLGLRVLLIDDVCTTGATLDACAKALGARGAQTVVGLTVARPAIDA